MLRYKVGETVIVNGRRGKVVWFREDPSEIEAMDEYMVEFDNREKRFFVAFELVEGTHLRRTA